MDAKSARIISSVREYNEQYPFYDVGEKFLQNVINGIPFRVSPAPLRFRESDQEIVELGSLIVFYFKAVMELYQEDERVKELLDRGKPQIYTSSNIADLAYLFIRPDLLLTPTGFIVCELETSTFGLAIAHILNRVYCEAGFETLVPTDALENYIRGQVPAEGTLAFSNKVEANLGQLEYLASQVFSSNGGWDAKRITEQASFEKDTIYRGFYLSEISTDMGVQKLVESKKNFIPTLTPQLEEKAILSFIWDKRFERFFKKRMGIGNFYFLRGIIPHTWIVGEEAFFAPGMPKGVNSSLDLASLPKSQRQFTLKQSGFSSQSQWGKGVKFLHKMSKQACLDVLMEAQEDKDHLYIVQAFHEGVKKEIEFLDADGEAVKMATKVRLCPYYSLMGKTPGDLIAAVATCCENTDYVHGMSTGVNTAVMLNSASTSTFVTNQNRRAGDKNQLNPNA